MNSIASRTMTYLLLLTGLAALSFPPASMAGCTDYSASIRWQGSVETRSAGNAVGVSGSYAYLGTYDSLLVVDLSDPTAPAVAGGVPASFPNVIEQLVAEGTDVYTLDHEGILTWYDASDPANPVFRASLDVGPPYADYGIGADGGFVYAACGDGGLRVLDRDPFGLIGGIDTPGPAREVAVQGRYAYVADGTSGLQIIDVSDPTAPVPAGNLDTPWEVVDVVVDGSFAYLADGWGGLRIVDVSNPASPLLVGSASLPQPVRRVEIWGSLAWVAYSSRVEAFDVSDPASPRRLGGFDVGGPDGANHLAMREGILCAACGYRCGPHSPTIGSLQLFDVEAREIPTPVGSLDWITDETGIVTSGDLAYLTDSSGLQIVDISDPAGPALMGFLAAEYAAGVFVAGPHAYVAAGSGLLIVDVSDPVAPALVGSLPTPYRAQAVAAEDGLAYLTDSHSFRVVDVSDPANPQIVGTLDEPGFDLVLAGNTAYVATAGVGVAAIDLSTPTAPWLLGYAYLDWASGVAIQHDRIYAVSGPCYTANGKLAIFDAADFSLLGSMTLPGSPIRVEVDAPFAYVAGDRSSLCVCDVSDPTHPRLLGGTPVGSVRDVAIRTGTAGDGWAFAAGSPAGLTIWPLQCPVALDVPLLGPGADRTLAVRVAPRPARDRAAIRIELPHAGRLDVRIDDVQGRRVRALLQSSWEAGARTLPWDGRDEAGRRVAAGVYWVRVSLDGERASAPVVLVP
jgi:hypothetical protein